MRDSPEADALLTTDRDRCLLAGMTGAGAVLPTGESSLLFSEEEVPVSKLL